MFLRRMNVMRRRMMTTFPEKCQQIDRHDLFVFTKSIYLCFLLLCRKEVRYKFLIVLHGDDDCTMHVCSGQAEKSTVRGKDDIALEKQESVEVMKDKYSDDFDDTNSDDFNDTNGDDADCMRERMGKCRMHLEGRKVLWLLPNHCNLPCALLALFALCSLYSIYSTNTLATYSFFQSLQPALCTPCTICPIYSTAHSPPNPNPILNILYKYTWHIQLLHNPCNQPRALFALFALYSLSILDILYKYTHSFCPTTATCLVHSLHYLHSLHFAFL